MLPRQQRRPADSRSAPSDADRDAEPHQDDEQRAHAHEAKEPPATFVELVNELNRALLELEYALLDLQEMLVRCNRGRRRRLEQEAASVVERIRIAARDGTPPA